MWVEYGSGFFLKKSKDVSGMNKVWERVIYAIPSWNWLQRPPLSVVLSEVVNTFHGVLGSQKERTRKDSPRFFPHLS